MRGPAARMRWILAAGVALLVLVCAPTAFSSAEADLVVTLSHAPQTPAIDAGEASLTWTMAATNNGPGTAANVKLTLTLPVGFDAGTLPAGCTGSPVVCTVGDLASGASASFDIPAQTSTTQNGAKAEAVGTSDTASPTPGDAVYDDYVSVTGPEPNLTFDQPPVDFPDTIVGQTSTPVKITATNNGANLLLISSLGENGSFHSFPYTTTCGSSLAVGASCTVTVTFAPASAGDLSASFVFVDNETGGQQSIDLSGTGIGSTVDVSTDSLSFPPTAVGLSSPPQTITLVDTSKTVPLYVFGAELIGPPVTESRRFASTSDYTTTNGCTAVVKPGRSCKLTVRFTPGSAGDRPNQLQIDDNADDAPHIVALDGEGVAPALQLDQSALSFDPTAVGHKSTPATVNITNVSGDSVKLTAVHATGAGAGQFGISSGCPHTLAASASCAVTVVFQPTKAGAAAATLSVVNNGVGSPETVGLSGTGLPKATAAATPATLTFAPTSVGQTTATQTVTLTNTSSSTQLNVATVLLADPGKAQFELGNDTCTGAVLDPGGACTVDVAFAPGKKGTFTAHVQFSDDAAVTRQLVLLRGKGT